MPDERTTLTGAVSIFLKEEKKSDGTEAQLNSGRRWVDGNGNPIDSHDLNRWKPKPLTIKNEDQPGSE